MNRALGGSFALSVLLHAGGAVALSAVGVAWLGGRPAIPAAERLFVDLVEPVLMTGVRPAPPAPDGGSPRPAAFPASRSRPVPEPAPDPGRDGRQPAAAAAVPPPLPAPPTPAPSPVARAVPAVPDAVSPLAPRSTAVPVVAAPEASAAPGPRVAERLAVAPDPPAAVPAAPLPPVAPVAGVIAASTHTPTGRAVAVPGAAVPEAAPVARGPVLTTGSADVASAPVASRISRGGAEALTVGSSGAPALGDVAGASSAPASRSPEGGAGADAPGVPGRTGAGPAMAGSPAASAAPAPGSIVASLPAGGSGGAVSPEYEAYVRRLRERVQRRLVYPRMAVRRGEQGTVELDVEVGPDGRLAGIVVVEGAGPAALAAAAVEAVRAAGPFPFPDGLPPRALVIRLPVVFRLR